MREQGRLRELLTFSTAAYDELIEQIAATNVIE